MRGTVAEPLHKGCMLCEADNPETLQRVPSITVGYFLSPFKNIGKDIFCWWLWLENYTVSLGCAFKICKVCCNQFRNREERKAACN